MSITGYLQRTEGTHVLTAVLLTVRAYCSQPAYMCDMLCFKICCLYQWQCVV